MIKNNLPGPTLTRPALALVLAVLMGIPPAAWAQQAPSSPATPLRIIPLAGRNGQNDLQSRIMAPLAVQVLDENDRPVREATVIFRFPLNGPSATFADGQKLQIQATDALGQARATGWMANSELGSFVVSVTATQGSAQGSLAIPMFNVPRVIPESEQKPKRWWTSRWAKIGYIAAGAGIAAAIVLSNRSSNTTIRGIPGSPTIGGPF